MPNVPKYYNINVKKIVISTFKCQDLLGPTLGNIMFSLECMLGKQSIHPKCKALVCLHGYGTGRTKKMQSGED
jgi:hypothetical protein